MATVSMPPRRSCFLHLVYGRCAMKVVFQCHHGVPASSAGGRCSRELQPVSMPPRRSCFPIIPQGGGLLSSPGRDIEGDGDRWVRTSVGFDGSFVPSSSIPPSEIRGSFFLTLDHLPVPQPRMVVFLKKNGLKRWSSV